MSEKWFKAVMIDLARVTERYDYYQELIPRLSHWGYNTLFWHFTDDQGCALKLKSHPELASRYALSREETAALIRLAADHGIEMIPEVESLGHTLYITHLKKYRHLFEGSETHFNAICPSHPETLKILGDVLAETAEIFPSLYLHVGLDEVQFGACPRCRKRGLPPWRLFTEHLAAVHRIVTALGKQTIIWGDHLVKDERIARRVPRDVLVAHWDYWACDRIEPDNRRLLDHGFEVLCCPATARYMVTVMPNETNLANLRQFAAVAKKHRRRGVRGLVNTVWCPERQLGASTHFGLALGAALFENPKVDEQQVAERFVREEYGLGRPKAPARALRLLHEATPGMMFLRKFLVEDAASRALTIDIADLDEVEIYRDALDKAGGVLVAAAPRVTRHREEYGTWLTAIEILDDVLSRAQVWQDVVALDHLRLAALKDRDAAGAREYAALAAESLQVAARGARRFGHDGYVRSPAALPGLLARSATRLEKLAARARKISRTGRGALGLPAGLIGLLCRA